MNPIGIGLAFLVFWSLVAAGTFLILTAGGRLRHLTGRRMRVGEVAHIDTATGVAVGLHLVTLLIGAAMVFAGVYATYVVLVGR